MIDKKATTARNDLRKVMHDSSATMLHVLVNDKVNHLRKPLTITGITPALNGTVVLTDDGLNVSYAPPAGYSGVDPSLTPSPTRSAARRPRRCRFTVLGRRGYRQECHRGGRQPGTTPATFNVVLSNQSLETVTVNYQTVNGTAVAGSDYTATSGTVSFAPLVTSMPITVPVLGDTLAEFNEKFSVRVSDPTNATIAAAPGGDITITDDDPPEISIAATATIVEGNTGSDNVAVVVTLSQPHFESVFVNYATADGTAVPAAKPTNTERCSSDETATKTISCRCLRYASVKDRVFYVDLSVRGTARDGGDSATVARHDDNTAGVQYPPALGRADGAVRIPEPPARDLLAPCRRESGTSLRPVDAQRALGAASRGWPMASVDRRAALVAT